MLETHPLLHGTYPFITSPWPGLWQVHKNYEFHICSLSGQYLCEVTVTPGYFAMAETANMTVIGKKLEFNYENIKNWPRIMIFVTPFTSELKLY